MAQNIRNCYCRGKLISLRHPTEEDIDRGWFEWFSDEEVTRNLTDAFWPNSREAQLQYYQSLLNQGDRLSLSIVHNDDAKLIGTCSLSRINWPHRYASIAVVIGEKEFRRGAIAIEAYNLLLRVAFERLNLNTVMSFSSSSNTGAHGVHKIVGFVPRGTVPQIYDIGGETHDMVISSVDRHSWLERQAHGVSE